MICPQSDRDDAEQKNENLFFQSKRFNSIQHFDAVQRSILSQLGLFDQQILIHFGRHANPDDDDEHTQSFSSRLTFQQPVWRSSELIRSRFGYCGRIGSGLNRSEHVRRVQNDAVHFDKRVDDGGRSKQDSPKSHVTKRAGTECLADANERNERVQAHPVRPVRIVVLHVGGHRKETGHDCIAQLPHVCRVTCWNQVENWRSKVGPTWFGLRVQKQRRRKGEMAIWIDTLKHIERAEVNVRMLHVEPGVKTSRSVRMIDDRIVCQSIDSACPIPPLEFGRSSALAPH